MRFCLKTSSALFALSIVLLSLAPVASAGPKEDVVAATSNWARALGEDDPDKVLPLYSEDAVLWNLVTNGAGRSCGVAGLFRNGLQSASRPQSHFSGIS